MRVKLKEEIRACIKQEINRKRKQLRVYLALYFPPSPKASGS